MGKHSRTSNHAGRRVMIASVAGIGATAMATAGSAQAAEIYIPNTNVKFQVADGQLTPGGPTAEQVQQEINNAQHLLHQAAPQFIPAPVQYSAQAPAPIAAPAFQSVGQRIAEAAQSRIGSPYVWGATGPSSFDCSGLVKWSYEQVGMSIPRTSYSQLGGGTPVPMSQLQPGDIIGGYGGGHVGVYVGNGMVVHAPDVGQTVKQVPLSQMGGNTAVRYA